MSPSVLIGTRGVSDVEVAGRGVKTSFSLRRATCSGGHIEALATMPLCQSAVGFRVGGLLRLPMGHMAFLQLP